MDEEQSNIMEEAEASTAEEEPAASAEKSVSRENKRDEKVRLS